MDLLNNRLLRGPVRLWVPNERPRQTLRIAFNSFDWIHGTSARYDRTLARTKETLRTWTLTN